MGPHAGESSEQIFSRKIKDIERTGNTFWMIQSNKSSPPKVQSLVREAKLERENIFSIFISPSTKGGSKQTKKSIQG